MGSGVINQIGSVADDTVTGLGTLLSTGLGDIIVAILAMIILGTVFAAVRKYAGKKG